MPIPTIDDVLYSLVSVYVTQPQQGRLPTFEEAIKLLEDNALQHGYSKVSEEKRKFVIEEIISQRAEGYKITLPEIGRLLYGNG